MNLFLQSALHLPSGFNAQTKQSKPKDQDYRNVYIKKCFSTIDPSRAIGYQKPKHLWMAKDQSVKMPSNTSEISSENVCLCSDSLANNDLPSNQGSESTPLRNNYNGISPSNSSSAPGTVAVLSSLTNTSSSPSNHPSPQIRFNNANISGSHYESPVAYPHGPPPCVDLPEFKPKRKRGRPPKAKSGDLSTTCSLDRKHPLMFNPKIQKDCSVSQPNSSSEFLTGGLKIRLRRDFSVDDPVCRAKFRSRKARQKSVQVFRIVESWCDADAPGGLAAKSSTVSPMSSNQTSGCFRVGDVVWAKLAGYPYWPSRISALYARTPHQLTQVSPESGIDDSFAVAATSADPTLALGFAAKVEWFAWNQCSYLSCAKLFPFVEYFSKLYSPRTRVKNYTEAVNMAKNIVDGSLNYTRLTSEPQSDIEKEPLGSLSLPTNTGHLRSNMSCPPDLHFSLNSLNESNQSNVLCLPDPQQVFTSSNPQFPFDGNLVTTESGPFPFSNLGANPSEFCLVSEQGWGPLPQIDVSGLNDFNSAVPTFSEDEGETNESLANQLKLGLDFIGI